MTKRTLYAFSKKSINPEYYETELHLHSQIQHNAPNGLLVLYCLNGTITIKPRQVAAENNPFANAFQQWTPMMQQLFQQIRNEKEYFEHFVGAEVALPIPMKNSNRQKYSIMMTILGRFIIVSMPIMTSWNLSRPFSPTRRRKHLSKTGTYDWLLRAWNCSILLTSMIRG